MQVETLLNAPVQDATSMMTSETDGKRHISLGRLLKKPKPRSELKAIREVQFEGFMIRELENGTIEMDCGGHVVTPAKPVLRELSLKLNVSLVNSSGNPLNTRQLGTQVINSIEELQRTEL
jgi:hypothetical protein